MAIFLRSLLKSGYFAEELTGEKILVIGGAGFRIDTEAGDMYPLSVTIHQQFKNLLQMYDDSNRLTQVESRFFRAICVSVQICWFIFLILL